MILVVKKGLIDKGCERFYYGAKILRSPKPGPGTRLFLYQQFFDKQHYAEHLRYVKEESRNIFRVFTGL